MTSSSPHRRARCADARAARPAPAGAVVNVLTHPEITLTALTPQTQLVADLVGPLQRTRGIGEIADADLSHIAPDLPDLIEAAHRRVRGMRAAVISLTTGRGAPVACAALRSSTGAAETADFVNLWCLALEAVEGKPRSVQEAIQWSGTPVDERIDRAYPGVRLSSTPADDRRSEFTLYARGEEAVRQLARLLRAAITAWPEPDWRAQVRREKFLRAALDAHAEGRRGDLRRLIEDFADAPAADPDSRN
ncbi:hypothetical protein ACFYZ8_33170 [Streptomyces sp. NPDC001668]|uniref:hypothetical protein n=1 Tax=Streptomyces sp. NPDC001668 TaxID=3364598 RepID=UPI0036B1F2F9